MLQHTKKIEKKFFVFKSSTKPPMILHFIFDTCSSKREEKLLRVWNLESLNNIFNLAPSSQIQVSIFNEHRAQLSVQLRARMFIFVKGKRYDSKNILIFTITYFQLPYWPPDFILSWGKNFERSNLRHDILERGMEEKNKIC